MSVFQDEDAPLVRDEDEDLFVIQSAQDFLEVKKAEYVESSIRLRRENELLFIPSMRPGTVSSLILLPFIRCTGCAVA